MTNYTTLSDRDLLKMLVMELPEGNITDTLFTEFHSLADILIDTEEVELLSIKGIGKRRASQIKAVSELARRLYQKSLEVPYKITGPQDVAQLVMADMKYLKQEELRILVLNTKNIVLSVHIVSMGTVNASIVHPREVFRPAIRKAAASIILVHNHPSGDPTPSQEDFSATERVRESGKLLGIELLDHVIIGNSRFISLKELGAL